jgi:imidazolonepropionase-like amidohydrolase
MRSVVLLSLFSRGLRPPARAPRSHVPRYDARNTTRVVLCAALLSCGGATPPASHAERLPDPPLPPLPWEAPRGELPDVASPLVALVGGTVLTGTSLDDTVQRIEDGVVVMENGRIRAVGAAGEVEIPEGAQRVDVRGRFVTPGLIDVHSHMGVYSAPGVQATSDGNEMTGPVTPGVRAADGFWPQDPALPRALAGGVTTIQVLPGSANLIGGAGAILKMHLGRGVTEMEFPGAPETLKMACGENPKRVYGERNQAPRTRMGNVHGYRAAFQEAIEYGRSWRAWQAEHRAWQRERRDYEREREASAGDAGAPEEPGPEPDPPARDFGHERLLGAIEGRVLVQMHCYRADEMLRIIEIGDELGFRVRSFHHAVEAYKIRDVLAERGISISTWADWWGFKLEAFDAIEENLALLTQGGVRGVVHSDSAMLVQRLNQEAAKAMTSGRRSGVEVTEEQALSWITANAAWTLGIDELTGTLEAGKMADVVVWSAHPFSVYARADLVYVDGLLEHDRSAPVRPSDFELGLDLEQAIGGAR